MSRLITMILMMVSISAFANQTNESKVILLSNRNTVTFNQSVTPQSCNKALGEIMLRARAGVKEIYLFLNTPGGSVIAGMNFIDAVKALPVKVHTITQFAASMGYQFVQNLDNRYILPSGVLMSHRASGSISGQIPGELIARHNFYLSLINKLDNVASKRTGLSMDDYQKLVRDEYWVSGANAVSKKHADEVVLARCDSSLLKFYKKQVRYLFANYTVVFSKCPLINGPISVNNASSKVLEGIKKQYNHMQRVGIDIK